MEPQLLDRQKDDEDRRAMEVISWLGQNGHLAAPAMGNAANRTADSNADGSIDDHVNANVEVTVEDGILAPTNGAPQSDTPV